MTLEPRPGFDWSRMRWDDADKPQRNDCSYCGVEIPEDAVPLRFWKESGDSAVLCDGCVERWCTVNEVNRRVALGLAPLSCWIDPDEGEQE